MRLSDSNPRNERESACLEEPVPLTSISDWICLHKRLPRLVMVRWEPAFSESGPAVCSNFPF